MKGKSVCCELNFSSKLGERKRQYLLGYLHFHSPAALPSRAYSICSFVPVLDWFPSSFFVTLRERVFGRSLGGSVSQKTKTGKICQIPGIQQKQDDRINRVSKRLITRVYEDRMAKTSISKRRPDV